MNDDPFQKIIDRRNLLANVRDTAILGAGIAIFSPFAAEIYYAYKESAPSDEEIAAREREIVDMHNTLKTRYPGVTLGVHFDDEALKAIKRRAGLRTY
jgi:fructosamine-3-kinase